MTAPRRNDAYAMEMSDAELDRLLVLGDLYNPFVPDGFRRTTIGPGDKVIDVGCGAVGALSVLSDLVGPMGTVVGLDVDEQSLGLARRILDRQGREHVRLVHGNINELDPAMLCPPGPFDAAFSRLFLIHQPDPAATLRRMAAFVRPGGYIVVHELLLVCQPSVPDVPALHATFALWNRTMGARGASPDVATRLSAVCTAAGLREVDQHGWFANRAATPAAALAHGRATTEAFRTAIIETGTATAAEVDALQREIEAAGRQEYDLLVPGTFMELVAQVPQATA